MKKKAKILLYDIETQPNLVWVWGYYEQNTLDTEQPWEIMSVAWKWLGEKETHVMDRFGKKSDKAVVKKLWKLFNEADIAVAHNGDRFDHKKVRTRMLVHEMKPPAPFKSIDTKKVASKHFGFSSNKLNELAKRLGIGTKVQTGGFELWKGCMKGKKEAQARMRRYNKQDVVLLEKVYLKLRAWETNHPNVAALEDKPQGCPNCGSERLKSHGWRYTKTRRYVRYFCKVCGAWCRGRTSELVAERS